MPMAGGPDAGLSCCWHDLLGRRKRVKGLTNSAISSHKVAEFVVQSRRFCRVGSHKKVRRRFSPPYFSVVAAYSTVSFPRSKMCSEELPTSTSKSPGSTTG